MKVLKAPRFTVPAGPLTERDTLRTYQLTIYRLYCALVALLTPLFWIFAQVTAPHLYDPIWVRLAISISFLGLLLGSYTSERLQAHFARVVNGASYLLTAALTYIVARNAYYADYTVILVLAVTGIGTLFALVSVRRRQALVYVSFATGVNIIGLWLTEAPQVNALVVVGGLGGASLASMVASYARAQERILLFEKERQLSLLAEHTKDMIGLHALDGRYMYASPSSMSLLGYASDAVVGTSVSEWLHAGDARELVEGAYERAREGKPSTCARYRMRRRNGSYVWCETYIVPVFDKTGKVAQLVTSTRNVTRTKQAEDRLRASQRRYRKLLETANDAILVVDAQTGNILDANPKAQDVLGYEMKALTHVHHLDLFPADQQEEHQGILQSVLKEGTAFCPDLLVVRQNGQHIPVDISLSLLELEEQRLVLAIMRDVTQRRTYEQGLIEAKERAEEMSQLKSTVLANMSHEIRTPLTAILGFASILGEELGEPHRHFAQLIQRSGQRLLNTLNSVLDLAQLESGGIELHPEEMDLVEVVQDTVDLYRPQAEGQELTMTLDAPAQLSLYQDPAGVQRILSNLLSNALKFTLAGSIHVSVRDAGGTAEIIVEDTGIGVDADFLPRMFDEFRQESTGIARTHEGNGLGLTITRHLIALMAGTIEVESKKGEGSRFVICLPFHGPSTVSGQEAPEDVSLAASC